MNLFLIRHTFTPYWTAGSLYIENDFECFTLEDADRLAFGLKKVPGETAIDAGVYLIRVTPSPRFKRHLPQLMNVPQFEGVRIHPGNTAGDTEGCILVGTDLRAGMVVNSRVAFEPLFRKLKANDNASIKIVRAPMAPGLAVDIVGKLGGGMV